jgi:hypothetical protein
MRIGNVAEKLLLLLRIEDQQLRLRFVKFYCYLKIFWSEILGSIVLANIVAASCTPLINWYMVHWDRLHLLVPVDFRQCSINGGWIFVCEYLCGGYGLAECAPVAISALDDHWLWMQAVLMRWRVGFQVNQNMSVTQMPPVGSMLDVANIYAGWL